jgi:hypothetical protein
MNKKGGTVSVFKFALPMDLEDDTRVDKKNIGRETVSFEYALVV